MVKKIHTSGNPEQRAQHEYGVSHMDDGVGLFRDKEDAEKVYNLLSTKTTGTSRKHNEYTLERLTFTPSGDIRTKHLKGYKKR